MRRIPPSSGGLVVVLIAMIPIAIRAAKPVARIFGEMLEECGKTIKEYATSKSKPGTEKPTENGPGTSAEATVESVVDELRKEPDASKAEPKASDVPKESKPAADKKSARKKVISVKASNEEDKDTNSDPSEKPEVKVTPKKSSKPKA